MKQALCVNSYEELTELVQGKKENIEAKMVDREICEDPTSGYQQLITYVTFYTVDLESAKLKMVQYLRPSVGEGEERLQGKTSIGFGGHIDLPEEVVCELDTTEESGEHTYKMTLQNIIDTGFKAGAREVQEELGFDIEKDLEVDITKADTAFFIGDSNDEVNQVHIGFSIQIKLSEEQYDKLMAIKQHDKEEIEVVDTLGISIDKIVEEMDLSFTVNKIIHELSTKHSLEDWSCKIFNYITRKEIFELTRHITYADLYKVKVEKEQSAKSDTQQELFH